MVLFLDTIDYVTRIGIWKQAYVSQLIFSVKAPYTRRLLGRATKVASCMLKIARSLVAWNLLATSCTK